MSFFIKEAAKATEAAINYEVVKKAVEDALIPKNYIVLNIDLTKANTNKLYDMTLMIKTAAKRVYVQRADDTAYLKFNKIEAPSLEALPGDTHDMIISKIFVTNPASAISGARLVLIIYY